MKLPNWLRDRLDRWATRVVLSRDADFVLADEERIYMLRWHVIPPNPVFSLYVHMLCDSDIGRDMHDHRSATLSVILRGGYLEWVPWNIDTFTAGYRGRRGINRSAGDVVVRGPRAPHILEVDPSNVALTLFATGPTVRRWGFWTDDGWVRHDLYLAAQKSGAK